MFQALRTSLIISMAARLSVQAGALSIGSSVRLKSPRTKSGKGRHRVRLFIIVLSQKSVCLVLSWGAYILTMEVEQESSHFMLSMMALPGSSTFMEYSLGLISALFMIKATPADARGFSGSGEFIIIRFRPKHSCI